jgi:hypothetical protein
MKTCIVDGCENKRHVKIGYCGKHYAKYKQYGDPLAGRTNTYGPGQVPKECIVEGCHSKPDTRGLCRAHHLRKKRLGSVDALYESEKPRYCSIEGCERKHYSKSYCSRHYNCFLAHGDPLYHEKNSPTGWIDRHKDYDGDDCLRWPFSTLTNGYGTIQTKDGRKRIASRVMCEAAHGMPPKDDMQAAHSCGNGNKGCVNPRHLRWATVIDNCHDRYDHGTHLYGEKAPWSKLTEDQARMAKYDLAHLTAAEVANILGVKPTTIYCIRQGRNWRHI